MGGGIDYQRVTEPKRNQKGEKRNQKGGEKEPKRGKWHVSRTKKKDFPFY